MNKDHRRLFRWLQEHGYEVVRGRVHVRVHTHGGVVILGSSPGGGRAWQNAIAQLRRQGVPLPRKTDNNKGGF